MPSAAAYAAAMDAQPAAAIPTARSKRSDGGHGSAAGFALSSAAPSMRIAAA
jgi:hypothetical protein